MKIDQILNQADIHAINGEADKAKQLYSMVLEKRPQNKKAKKGLKALQNAATQNTRLNPIETLISPVISLYSKGQIIEALETLNTLISDNPNEPVLYNIAGTCYAGLGKMDEAINSYEQALKIKPDFSIAHDNLGNALRITGQFEKAVASHKRALMIKPGDAYAHNNLGIIFNETGQFEAAVESFEQALKINPNYAEAHNNLGVIFNKIGKSDAAFKSFERALKINPNYAEAHNNLGTTHRGIGQLEAALESYERAAKINPNFASAHRHISSMKQYQAGDIQIDLMERLLSNPELNNADRMQLCFALSKVNEDLGKQEEMFKYLHEGNRLRKEALNYSIDKDKRLDSITRELFSAQSSAVKLPTYSRLSTIKPIFIVGMPRSGTSLVEQILASHTNVHGAGELNTISKLIIPIINESMDKGASHQQSLISKNDINTIRNGYLDSLFSLNVAEDIITDKMPLNFRWIGFILSAFPEAKIIHLSRDPRATCWSIYKKYFSSIGNGYAYNLDDLAGFYHLYTDLMTFWHQCFPNKIYDICYEDLTKNQEDESRKLLEYCELNWEQQCLYFHKTKRAVTTASAIQVRKKMYQGSSDAWKQHKKYLEPLLRSLKR